jgi:DNA-directed RNA polymerase subunit RPC12/RpoP
VSEVGTFFRQCPACGRRFEIRLVSKRSATDDGELEKPDELPPVPDTIGATLSTDSINQVPELRDREEVRYVYECKHCGHKWSETRMKTSTDETPADYSGD